ncbi:Unannotated [Lentimonas sp. CC19]|nr:Unannotated [Lentimonas sp. CC19]CAA6695826.1 Unannotated [Lentimonas sp. CC10]CAA7069747.1 Unannotated [Lentimonas sp. CC11]
MICGLSGYRIFGGVTGVDQLRLDMDSSVPRESALGKCFIFPWIGLFLQPLR